MERYWCSAPWENTNIRGLKSSVDNWFHKQILEEVMKVGIGAHNHTEKERPGRHKAIADVEIVDVMRKSKTCKELTRNLTKMGQKITGKPCHQSREALMGRIRRIEDNPLKIEALKFFGGFYPDRRRKAKSS